MELMRMNDKFILLCQCGWKRITDLSGEAPALELKNDTLSGRKFRCPSCGMAVAPRKTKDPQAKIDMSRMEAEAEEENRRWLEDSLERQHDFIREIRSEEEDHDQ